MSVGTISAQDALEADSLGISPARHDAVSHDELDIVSTEKDGTEGQALNDSIGALEQIDPADSLAVAPKKEPPFKSRVKYKAKDSVVLNLQTNRTFMYHESQVNYEDIELKAYKTEFDMTTKIVYAAGARDSLGNYVEAPEFKMGGGDYTADSMSYSFNTGRSIIYHIRTQQGEGFLLASKSKRYPDGHIDMGGGIYTTCDDPNCPHFGLRLSKGKVIPGDKVVFGFAYLELLEIPLYILALPFGFFPQTNKEAVSGIIPPTIGMEISRGMSLTNGGYYYSFNDHFDAQIMGDVYSTGTWRTSLTTRYIKRYKFSGNIDMSYGVTVSGEKGLDQSKQKQYSILWSHRQDAKANPHHSFQASVNYSSSKYDKEFNYTNMNAVYNNTKNSSISFSQKWPNTPFSFSTNFRASQNSNNQQVSIDFPNFNFRMERIYPFRKKEAVGKPKWYEDIALQYDATMQNSLTGHEDNLFSDKNIKEMKNGFQHKVPFSINFKALKFFNITPSINYTGVVYTSKIKKTFDPDSLVGTTKGILLTDTIRGLSYAHSLSPSLSISMTPKFYLTNRYDHKPNSKVEAIRTVISPNVAVNYVPDLSRWFDYYEDVYDTHGDLYLNKDGKVQNYSIYERVGAYGTPTAPGQSGGVSLGINGNVEMKVRSTDSTALSKKVKILNNISATTRYNIFADSMKWSNISLSANTTIFGMNLTASGSVDPYKLTPAGNRVDQYGPRLTNMNFSTGISLPLNKEKKKEEEEKKLDDGYSYFDVPWNVSFNYGLSYTKRQFVGEFTQTLSFSGNINFTKKWSLNFSSSYDFKAKEIANANFSINRDLHCWQMTMSFSPFGLYKFYNFKINVKSSTLQDLKYEKKKTQSDFSRERW